MISVGALKRILPHRFPILLVDRVLEVVPGDRIVAEKAVTCNEPWYERVGDETADEGYAYPVALLVESWCQAALALAGWDRDGWTSDELALFGGISGIEVVGQVWPGDVVRHEVRIDRAFGDTWVFTGTATVDGAPVLSVGSVMAALRPTAVVAGGRTP